MIKSGKYNDLFSFWPSIRLMWVNACMCVGVCVCVRASALVYE